ncbi:MAG: rhodanese-like domain-containing protein [Bacteroidales bacterium]|nr:rhodanese-like domain-containing protein [Bacteroidales bacterium]
MNEVENAISKMDFQYFGTGQHKIDAESFLKKEDSVFLDVRAKEETETIKIVLKHHLPVIEIPLHELPSRLNELPKDKHIGVFCSSGVRCSIAFAYLKHKGFENVRIVEGGYVQLLDALNPGKVYKHLNK